MSKLKQSFLTIVIGLALAAGLSYAWNPPTATPPNNNASAPINVSESEQGFVGNKTLKVKSGTGVLSLFGALKVNGIFQLIDGTQGPGKVLTSDAQGLASWGTPSIKIASGLQKNFPKTLTNYYRCALVDLRSYNFTSIPHILPSIQESNYSNSTNNNSVDAVDIYYDSVTEKWFRLCGRTSTVPYLGWDQYPSIYWLAMGY